MFNADQWDETEKFIQVESWVSWDQDTWIRHIDKDYAAPGPDSNIWWPDSQLHFKPPTFLKRMLFPVFAQCFKIMILICIYAK